MRFSVVIPAYNAEKFINRSVESVLGQSFPDFEIIVVNDGSKDNTLGVLKDINDERLVVIDQENQGVSVARNNGIQNAKGEFICFLDADDEFLPKHMEHLDELIKTYPERSFFSTTFCISMRDDADNIVMPETNGSVVYYENFVREMITHSEKICTGCICIKREMFENYGMFEPGVKIAEDTDMWERVYVHTGAVYSDNITVKRNRDGSEATRQYARGFDADPLNRMPVYLSDDTISDDVKESLKIQFELKKLSVVRSYLFVGDKTKARLALKNIDKSKISKKRMYVTYVCFLVPSQLIRWCLKVKNRGIYE